MGQRIILVAPELIAAFLSGCTRPFTTDAPKDLRVVGCHEDASWIEPSMVTDYRKDGVAFLCESAEWDEQKPVPIFKPVASTAEAAPPGVHLTATGAHRKIDGKYHIEDNQVIKTTSGEVVPEYEPLILFRARDRLALPALYAYKAICHADGCNDHQMAKVQEIIDSFEEYARTHPTKQPGVARGAAWVPPSEGGQ